jgi:uncharacterized membrane protein (DUF373 family)
MKIMSGSNFFKEKRKTWSLPVFYQRFEEFVSIVLTLLIALIVVVAVIHLVVRVFLLILSDAVDPANQVVFQTIFGMIMTVLIALEFKNSLVKVLERRNGIVQVKSVALIALLALVRKFIIIDASHVEPVTIIGMALAVLALGGVYWMVQEQDRREAEDERVRKPSRLGFASPSSSTTKATGEGSAREEDGTRR